MPEPTPLDLLVRGYDLIRDESGWTQNHLATDKYGRKVHLDAPEAQCFCARGAVARAAYEAPGDNINARTEAFRVLDQESRRLFQWGIVCVNDGRRGEATHSRSGSHKRVVMVYEEAITSLGGEVPR